MRTEDPAIEQDTRQPLPSLHDLIAVLPRQRWVMLTTFAVVVIGVAVSGIWIPKYDAKMKILVQRSRSDAMITSLANGPAEYSSDQVSEEDLNSEVELLNSEDLLRKVVLTTGLAGKSGPPDGHDSDVRIAKAVRKLSTDLTVEPLRKSNVISVQFHNGDPQMAAAVLKALAAGYIQKHLELHRSSSGFQFFNDQTQQYEQALGQAQGKLTNFTKRTGVVSSEVERDAALRQANDFDATARQAQTSVIETEQRVQSLETQLKSMKPRMITVERTSDNPQLMQQLKSTLLNLQLKRTELLTKYQPTYRLVREVDQQIVDTKSAINGEEGRPIREESSDLDPNYQWVKSELTKAQTDLSGLKARATAAASIARQYHESAQRLEQDRFVQEDLLQAAKTQEGNYLLYVRKREEARISDALDLRGILNVALVEQPVIPALPNRSLLNVALLTLLLATSASICMAFIVDFLHPSFRTADELAKYLGTPVLASMP